MTGVSCVELVRRLCGIGRRSIGGWGCSRIDELRNCPRWCRWCCAWGVSALYLDRVPDAAAVNESVRLIKQQSRRLGRDWSGFVNAVLRALLRSPEPAWPEVAQDPAFALSVRYSCPGWLAERWCRDWGVARAEALCRATVELPPTDPSCEYPETSRTALLAELAAANVDASPTMISEVGIQLAHPTSVTDLPGFAAGHFMSKMKGQLIPPLLDAQPGQRVLDACAAPGERRRRWRR